MAKRLRAFFKRLTGSEKTSDQPTTVPFTLPDGRIIDVPTKAIHWMSASFKSHRIVMNLPNRLEVEETIGLKIAYGIVVVIAAMMLVFLLPMMCEGLGKYFKVFSIVLWSVSGGFFVILGVVGMLGYTSLSKAVMDRRVGLYWKGRPPRAIRSWVQPPVALEKIAAVQVCSLVVWGSEGDRFTAYEMNLLLTDPLGERIHLMSHGERSGIESDAKQVAEFLNRPILNHIF